jgi:hypothetical protein
VRFELAALVELRFVFVAFDGLRFEVETFVERCFGCVRLLLP